ncbi:MAG TPA: phosphatidylinositol-specific phospholipase C1-like protein [Thermoanaerobaculia bacterium]|nr:phosphatidylinositol-specific phospholipase C1-like protein [Thermoanaerobaculia bacterium]
MCLAWGGCADRHDSSASSAPPGVADVVVVAEGAVSGLRLDQIQVLGSHNSYKLAIRPRLLDLYRGWRGEAASALDYWHPPLAAQLDHGLRKLELDVFYDPEGGRYARPGGLVWAPEEGAPEEDELAPDSFDPKGELARPGFKVLHVQDLDFRSSCLTLAACLGELRAWSERHPGHLPIVVTLNAKDQRIEREGLDPAFVEPLPFDAAALDALDAEIVAALGRERLLVPDDVRGDAPSLETAVLERGWPLLEDVRGRFLFVLDEGGAKLETYLEGHPSLEGRVLFVDVEPRHPAAAVRIVNDPIERGDEIRDLVRRGYLVRTRADADTREARAGDTTRRDAAFASGAQFVSTDYYLSEQAPGTGYLVELPWAVGVRDDGRATVARCNPVTAARICMLVGGASP